MKPNVLNLMYHVMNLLEIVGYLNSYKSPSRAAKRAFQTCVVVVVAGVLEKGQLGGDA